MKAFYAPEYIKPVLDEIRILYKPTGSPAAFKALRCKAILQKRTGRDCIAIREPDEGGFYYSGPAMRELLKAAQEWSEAAETEPGELESWLYQEERRIMEAVRQALINEYGNEGRPEA